MVHHAFAPRMAPLNSIDATQGQTDRGPKFITAKRYSVAKAMCKYVGLTTKKDCCYSRGKAKLSACQIPPSISLALSEC